MVHTYNRTAFRPGRLDVTPSSSPLLSAYCRLVSIEMLLKDYLRNLGEVVKNNHDVPIMLTQLALKLPAHTAEINSLNSALKTSLTTLWCNGPSKAQQVPSYSYPYMRYLRHDSDHATKCNPDKDVIDLEALTQQIQTALFTITGSTI